jgi:hypothetical protein
MPFVIFVAPVFSPAATGIIEAIARLPQVTLGLISQEAVELLPLRLRGGVAAHWRIDNVLDTPALLGAVNGLVEKVGQPLHRVFGAFEQLQVPIAEVRRTLGIEGMTVEAATNFRDKARMKELFHAHSIPCARHRLAHSDAEAWDLAREVGYPLVLKPHEGAGSQSTFRVDRDDQLRQALGHSRPGPHQPVLVEEFVTGDEHSLETVSIDGKAVWHSLTRYYPTPLEVLRNPWIQWTVVLPREVDDPQYNDIRKAGARALKVLGMQTGLSHLEWFRRKDGSLAISEVAARPPGAQFTTLITRAHDMDFLYAWARLMVYGDFDPPKRRFAVGAAYLRAQGYGSRIVAVQGLDTIEREVGYLIVDAKRPQLGAAPAPSYEGEGYLIVRHEDTGVVQQVLNHIVSTVRVELG